MNKIIQFLFASYFCIASSIAYSAVHSANGANNNGISEIRSIDGELVGYVHEVFPDANDDFVPDLPSQTTPVVFVPGFEIPDFARGGLLNEPNPGVKSRGTSLLNKISLSTGGSVIEELADQHGFAIYIIDFINNNQSVAENSKILERYLTSGTNGPNVTYSNDGTRGAVIGFSMGGLIARHALTKLEHEGKDHHVSLYLSVDAPHRGAFMPSSFEMVTRTLNGAAKKIVIEELFEKQGLDKSLALGVEAYDSDAAKELLGLYVGYRAEDASAQARLNLIESDYRHAAHPAHYSLRNSLRLMGGHPLELRSIAIAHGSFNGFPQHANAQSRDGHRYLTTRIKYDNIYVPGEELVRFYFNNDSVTTRRRPCLIRVLSDQDPCPLFKAPGQLANITSAPGSYTDALRQIDRSVDNTPNIIIPSLVEAAITAIIDGLAAESLRTGVVNTASLDILKSILGQSTISFAAHMVPGEGHTTFVPTLSALDINSLDWFGSANELKNLSPFDAVYANHNMNDKHEIMSVSLFNTLVWELSTTERDRIVERDKVAAIIATF